MTTLFRNAGVNYYFESGTHHARTEEESIEIKADRKLWTKTSRRKALAMRFGEGERRTVRRKKNAVGSIGRSGQDE